MLYMHGEENIAGWNAGLIADDNHITILRPDAPTGNDQ